jgi:hypothetical protein
MRTQAVCLAALILLVEPTLGVLAGADEGNGSYSLGSRVELFVDDELVQSIKGLRLQLQTPRLAEVVLRKDRPYEDSTLFDPVLMLDEGRYRLWYRTNFNQPPYYTGYAESADGVRWTKPSLGLVDFQGSRDNNLVWSSALGTGEPRVLSIFKDPRPGCPVAQRYKALCVVTEGKRHGLRPLASPDGLRWSPLRNEPVISDGAFDSHNIAFYDQARDRYVAYYRDFTNGVRHIKMATSEDFLHWTRGQFLDLGKTPPEHLYKNAATPYYRRPDLILMFPKRFLEQRPAPYGWKYPGLSDIVFMTSRDGFHFRRTFMEALVRPGLNPMNWHERAIEAGSGLVPGGPGEMFLCVVQHYRTDQVHIRRAVFRQDGLASLHAGYTAGQLLTRPLVFAGSRLVLNYSTSAAGSLRVEIQDLGGRPLPARDLASCREIYGDELERVVTWESGSDLAAWAGKPVRLRLVMSDADLFSFQFKK